MSEEFKLFSPWPLSGDQPEAVEKLVRGFEKEGAVQTLLGVTGSGKTFTMANVIQRLQRPTLVMAHNKTRLRLYGSSRNFSRELGQLFRQLLRLLPAEAYMPAQDIYIERMPP